MTRNEASIILKNAVFSDVLKGDLRFNQAYMMACDALKDGHWKVLDNCSNPGIYCSRCNNKIFDYPGKPKKKLSNFCPNCGSKNERFYNPETSRYMD